MSDALSRQNELENKVAGILQTVFFAIAHQYK